MVYDLFEVRMGAFVFNNKGKLFLTHHKKGTWGIIGGHLDKGEQIEDTVHREVKEEFNFEINIIKQFGLDTVKDSFIVRYACKYKNSKIQIMEPERFLEYKWVEIEELKKFNLTFDLIPYAKKAHKIVFGKKI